MNASKTTFIYKAIPKNKVFVIYGLRSNRRSIVISAASNSISAVSNSIQRLNRLPATFLPYLIELNSTRQKGDVWARPQNVPPKSQIVPVVKSWENIPNLLDENVMKTVLFSTCILACVTGRRKGGRKVKMRAGGIRSPTAIFLRPIFSRFTRSSFPFPFPSDACHAG